MAGSSLLMLIDDIATLLDDVAVMTKVATKKTAGVLGDDLALNAEQVAGVRAARELPVVFAVAKGSALNKVILVPLALTISAIAHWAITPALMLGGAFLAYEGFEKVAHALFVRKKAAEDRAHHQERMRAVADPAVDMVEFERTKVRGAIRTDFILSAEIVVITLGSVADVGLDRQLGVLVAVSVVMTLGVYGLVAAIVKLDDAGLALLERDSAVAKTMGRVLVLAAPSLMKGLAVAGTLAMFLVGGGILAHGIPGMERFIHAVAERAGTLGAVVPTLFSAVVGVAVGALIAGVVAVARRVRDARTASAR